MCGRLICLVTPTIRWSQSKGLECWPSEPLWEQLRNGVRLMHGGVNFELEPNPLGRKPETLSLGEHFDAVVLAIPVGALPGSALRSWTATSASHAWSDRPRRSVRRHFSSG